MNRVSRIDDQLRSLTKPRLEKVASITIEAGDLLVIAAGFEDRALITIKSLVEAGSSQFKVIAITYLPSVDENQHGEINDICRNHGIEVINLLYDRPNPLRFSETFINIIDAISGHLLIDVSAMSRFMIVQIIVALQNSFRALNKTTILYAEAFQYPPTKEEVNEALELKNEDNLYRCMFLSSGVFEVISVPELASVALQGQPVRLICFPSFNTDQLQALRGEIQPAFFSLIHGRPPLIENGWRLEAIRELNQTERLPPHEEFEVSTLDYVETLDVLLQIYSLHGATERLLISPTGSKMQTIAVAIFRAFMDDVQVVYPVPSSFPTPTNYTRGIRQLYSLQLDQFSMLKKPVK